MERALSKLNFDYYANTFELSDCGGPKNIYRVAILPRYKTRQVLAEKGCEHSGDTAVPEATNCPIEVS